jgi:hypothetical protein
MRAFACVCLAALIGIASSADAQVPAALRQLPPGFTVKAEQNNATAVKVFAERANDNFPRGHLKRPIRLEAGWATQPMAETVVRMVAQQPEEPAHRVTNTAILVEPGGKGSHRGGIMIWKKSTERFIGAVGREVPDLVTWDGSWISAAGDDKLLGVSVRDFVGSKAAAQAILDQMITQVLATAGRR